MTIARQTLLIEKNYNQNIPEYKFIIKSGIGNLTLNEYPDGWQDEITFERSPVYHGIFRSYSTNQLFFYKDAFDFIKQTYNLMGVTGEIKFTVYKYDFTTYLYVLYYDGVLDLLTYKEDNLGCFVQVIDSSFYEKFKTKEDLKVNLLDKTTVGGAIMPTFPTAIFDGGKCLKVPSFDVTKTAQLSTVAGVEYNIDIIGFSYLYAVVPVTEVKSQFVEANIPTYDGFYNFGYLNEDDQHQYVHLLHLQDIPEGDSHISVNVVVDLLVKITLGPDTHCYVTTRVVDKEGNIISEGTSYTISQEILNPYRVVHLDDDFDLYKDYSIIVTVDDPDNVALSHVYIKDVNIVITSIRNYSSQSINSFPIYEAFLRICQKITDQKESFISEFFGRTDAPYTVYDNDGVLASITKGKYLRLFDTTDDPIFSVSFKDLFESCSTIFNLGCEIPIVDRFPRVRVENCRYFYDSEVILDYSAIVAPQNVKIEVLPELNYGSCKLGYQNYDYETETGITEFNTSNLYSTIINTKTKYEKLSQLRTDTQGFIKMRQKPKILYQTEDVSGEDHVWIFDVKRDSGLFQILQDENFDSVTGEFPGADQYFNVKYSPARIIRNHGEHIRAGLNKQLSKYLRFQKTDKNSFLVSKETGEDEITENADILTNDLTEPFYICEKITFDAPFTVANMAALNANTRGLVKIKSNLYGWIMKLQTNNVDRKAQFELLRANLDVIFP